MVFSDTTNDTGIVQAVYGYTNSNSTSYPINDLTRNANFYYKRAVNLIQQSDYQWVWDDSNQTDLPIETTSLVNGQQDYGIGSDTRKIDRIQVLSEDGVSSVLQRLPYIEGSLDAVFAQDALPKYYDLLGESILLYPTPNYNKAAGLKIYPRRSASLFLYTDTTKEPGFDEQFHDYIALGASYEYLVSKTDRENDTQRIQNMILSMEEDMKRFYSRRSGKQALSVRIDNSE